MKIHYEKLKDLPGDILSFPSLIARITLAVLMLVFLGYVLWGFD
jgi:hypothetical protein